MYVCLLGEIIVFQKILQTYEMNGHLSFTPVDTGRKLNVHKTFRRCQNVLCTCNLRPVSTVTFNVFPIYVKEINKNEKIRPIKYPNGHMTYLEGT